MIRVMIVEDEPPIAQSIKILTEECDPGVQVVHIAINGRRALEYLEDNPVDIVFSDIRMPVMDGLELARNLQEQYPGIIMIIVSGFQEFEFARQAIRYGVSNYLLKPVSAEHIAEVLRSAVGEIREKREQGTRALLENAILSDNWHGQAHTGEHYGVVLMYGGAYPLIPDEGILGLQDLWKVSVIEELLQGQLAPGESGLCIRGRNQLELAAVFSADDGQHIRAAAQALFEQLSQTGEMAVTMAVWEEPVQLGGVGDVFTRLRGRIYKQAGLFRSKLLYGGEEILKNNWNADNQQMSLLLALKANQSDEIHRCVGELIDSAIFQSARQRDLELCLERILLRHFDGVLSMDEIGEVKYEMQTALSTSLHPSELVEELSRILYAWLNQKQLQSRDDDQMLCEQMAQFLRKHYRENIRSSDLARQFGYSSTQLAKRFKAHYGLSISEFVNQFRIELAQTIMQNNRKVMVKEVALDVGYTDQYYFSKLFKKITGIWPTEFQRGQEG